MDRPPDLPEPEPLTDERREELRARGYRPVEVWVRDRTDPAYLAEAARQARAAAEADEGDDIMEWVASVSGNPWDDE